MRLCSQTNLPYVISHLDLFISPSTVKLVYNNKLSYDLHLHIDDFKTNIEKEFNFLKEATCKTVENFQTLLNLQQMYSAALCSHVNNIYHKILEIQQQLPHSTQHMNTGDVIQIEAPDFDPDIDEGLPIQEHQEAQGSASITQQSFKKSDESKAPALWYQDVEDVD